MCVLNLLVMHYELLCTSMESQNMDGTEYVDNILAVTIDFCILLWVFWSLYRGRRAFFILCFSVTWLWSLSSVLYSRFFFSYLSISAVSQGAVLFNDFMVKCIIYNLRVIDLYYLLSLILFVILYKKLSYRIPFGICLKCLLVVFLLLFFDIFTHVSYCVSIPRYRYPQYFINRMLTRHFSSQQTMQQNYQHFCRGEIRMLGMEIVDNLHGPIELDKSQLRCIQETINSRRHNFYLSANGIPSYSNVVFIIVESYMSFVSDMRVKGIEVTPFLNKLKRDSTVYYNGKMKENVTIGESSDGQFIYMTGLLPLRSVVTVSKARKLRLPGLPKFLKRESYMVIPTTANIWLQDEMCCQYGFQHLFTKNDLEINTNKQLNDEQVFELTMKKEMSVRQPSFSVILTMSMHQPYIEQIDPTFPISDPSVNDELACYLNVCHYTDRQLNKYFEHLRETGQYDHSLIVIAADHPVHTTDFGGVSKDIPLYIVNVPVPLRNEFWQGECNQLDVYTTLLDLLGYKGDWYGLGQSLLSPNYTNNVPSKLWDVSEWIILGDFFSKDL